MNLKTLKKMNCLNVTNNKSNSETELLVDDPCLITDYSILCCICASPIEQYIPKYFMGNKFNPACGNCDDKSELNIFSSFPKNEPPPSLVSHWLLPNFSKSSSIGTITSLRSHYALLPKPGDCLISVEECFEMLKEFYEDQNRRMEEWLESLKGSIKTAAATT